MLHLLACWCLNSSSLEGSSQFCQISISSVSLSWPCTRMRSSRRPLGSTTDALLLHSTLTVLDSMTNTGNKEEHGCCVGTCNAGRQAQVQS